MDSFLSPSPILSIEQPELTLSSDFQGEEPSPETSSKTHSLVSHLSAQVSQASSEMYYYG